MDGAESVCRRMVARTENRRDGRVAGYPKDMRRRLVLKKARPSGPKGEIWLSANKVLDLGGEYHANAV